MKYHLPKKAREAGAAFAAPAFGDAGYDLVAAEDVIMRPGATVLVPTGLHLAIPEGHVGIIKDRSSRAPHISVVAGVIDESYRGEVMVMITYRVSEHHLNQLIGLIKLATGTHVAKSGALVQEFFEHQELYMIDKGDKIAQLVVIPVYTEDLVHARTQKALGTTLRGDKGFGSTGTRVEYEVG